jgi:hypothetical protein
MNTTASFFAQIDRLGPMRHQQSRVRSALSRRLNGLDRAGLIEFQRSFDAILAELRSADMWGAATLVLGPISVHELDPFLAWIACQGSHACQRVIRNPDAALEVLTRAGKRRRRPAFDQILELPWQLAKERFQFDLYAELGLRPRAMPPVLSDSNNEPDQLWPHPAALAERFPLLWEAFAAKGIRLFPQVHDTADVCACCGRVHAYVFGLLSSDGEPLGSYSLHWVEGEWRSVQSMVQLAEGDLYFALEHHQQGNESGSSLLELEEAPFQPEVGQFIGRTAGIAHPMFPLVASLAQLTLQSDPNARQFFEVWSRRSELAPDMAQRLARRPSRSGAAVVCTDCGQIHDETEIACNMPDELLSLSAWQSRWRLTQPLPGEWLLDGRRRFRRGEIPVPVKSRAEPYCYGVWIEQLDPTTGTDVLDSQGKRERLMRGARGLIANDLLFFPESTLGLEARIDPGLGAVRPRFLLEDDQTSPLAREQRKGMPARRPQQLMALIHR